MIWICNHILYISLGYNNSNSNIEVPVHAIIIAYREIHLAFVYINLYAIMYFPTSILLLLKFYVLFFLLLLIVLVFRPFLFVLCSCCCSSCSRGGVSGRMSSFNCEWNGSWITSVCW